MVKSGAMTETQDVYTGGTSPEDFAVADLPDVDAGEDGSEDGERDLGYGFITDPKTGKRRAKRAPGRPKHQPTADDLARQPPLEREADKPPQRSSGRRPSPLPAADDEPKMPKGGVIAAGVNKMYRRAGKIIRGFEHGDPAGIGQAFIECTKPDLDEPEEERELTVGEAWENLARSNPRIRRFLLRIVETNDIAALVMAHAPIGIAFAMKPWVQKLVPFGDMVESLTEPDEDEPEGTSMPGGLTREDIQQMADLTQDQADQLARKARDMARRAGVHLSDGEIQDAVAKAAGMQEGLPPGFRRQQPKKRSRAQRTGAGK